jgi:hypothetical protein
MRVCHELSFIAISILINCSLEGLSLPSLHQAYISSSHSWMKMSRISRKAKHNLCCMPPCGATMNKGLFSLMAPYSSLKLFPPPSTIKVLNRNLQLQNVNRYESWKNGPALSILESSWTHSVNRSWSYSTGLQYNSHPVNESDILQDSTKLHIPAVILERSCIESSPSKIPNMFEMRGDEAVIHSNRTWIWSAVLARLSLRAKVKENQTSKAQHDGYDERMSPAGKYNIDLSVTGSRHPAYIHTAFIGNPDKHFLLGSARFAHAVGRWSSTRSTQVACSAS